jgi:hypothetical protein
MLDDPDGFPQGGLALRGCDRLHSARSAPSRIRPGDARTHGQVPRMNHQFDELKRALLSATEAHYHRLHAQGNSQDLYGYSLYTDDSVMSIGPVANSSEKIAVGVDDPLHNYYRYGPQEWSIWDDHGLFEEVNRIIASIHDREGLSFDARRDGILQAAFEALVVLEERHVFGPRTDRRFVVLWIADSADPVMTRSARELNSDAVFLAYASEYAE